MTHRCQYKLELDWCLTTHRRSTAAQSRRSNLSGKIAHAVEVGSSRSGFSN